MDAVEMTEGLIQGDPAAPAFAQLIYDDCCKKLRQLYAALELILSFFDDFFLSDEDFEVAFGALQGFQPILETVGCILDLTKTKLLVTGDLAESQRQRVEALGIEIVTDGFLVLGTPVGNEAFIRNHLRGEVTEVQGILSKIGRADQLGRLSSSLSATQGLFTLVRQSANHLLRHLLRTVDPAISSEEFAPLDVSTVELVGRLFHASQHQLTDVRRTRISLPGALTGLGITPYGRVAEAAYLGCVQHVGPKLTHWLADPQEYLSGFLPAHQTLKQLLTDSNSSLLPDVQVIFYPKEELTKFERRHLQRSITAVIQKSEHQRIVACASGPEKFILQVTSPTTAGDFLFLPLANRRNWLPPEVFLIYGRLYLDLPVSASSCSICGGLPISEDAKHAHMHCQSAVTGRHDDVKDVIGAFFRHLKSSEQSPYNCRYEVPLVDLGFPKRGRESLRCDHAMQHVLTHDVIVTDVRITHPCRTVLRASKEPLYAAEANWKLKKNQYLGAHIIADNAIEPLVFEVYGGYSRRTYEFLRSLVNTIAGNDDALSARLWQDLRNRIAVALAKGQAYVIRSFFTYNSGQYFGQHFRSSRRSTASEQQSPTDPLAPWISNSGVLHPAYAVSSGLSLSTLLPPSSSVTGPSSLPSTVTE
jgi:hypothetical protein